MSQLEGMPCQELVEVITDYLEGALSPQDRLRFEEHLALCSGCRNYLEQMRVTISLTGALRTDSIPDGVREQLLSAFRDWKRDLRT
jgi:predicted anti-sigma-YlaC factor YlaD